MSTPRHTTRQSQQRFLDAYRSVGTVVHAAKISAVAPRTHYTWLEKDEAYVSQFEDAKQDATEELLREARRRAFEGVKRKKFHNGVPVTDPETGEQYIEAEYSDTLLIFLLKGLMPNVFRERQDVRINGRVDSAVTVYLPDNGRADEVEA
jgi:hypothetical protein